MCRNLAGLQRSFMISCGLANGPTRAFLPSASSARTQQRGGLYRVPPGALGKKGLAKGILEPSLPSVRSRRHSTNREPLLSVRSDTRQILPSLSVVMTTFLCRVPGDTRQCLCRVPDKKYYTKKSLPMYNSSRPLCQKSHSAKSLSSVF
jgi:hypothetical protein